MDWRNTRIAPDGTHHQVDGRPLYPVRFREVLKFHAPGLAPVLGDDGATHIDVRGKPLYRERYSRTFGFYEGLAAVDDSGRWFHVHPEGIPAHAERYAWCGNFQGGRCTVRRADGTYSHILPDGRPVYDDRWAYAGDYRDGIAVVQRSDGLHTHIDETGRRLHDRWFVDLDVFHKGFARARGDAGWHHVDRSGRALYRRRFASVEPFYNGQARVERFDGGLEVVREDGATTALLATTLGPVPHTFGRELHRNHRGAVYEGAACEVIKSCSDLEAWRRERLLLRLLNGKGAPRLLRATRDARTGYLVLGQVSGPRLGGRNQAQTRPRDEILRIAGSLLDTLQRLHAAGWAHTDVHPQNVVLEDGEPVLLDHADVVPLDERGTWEGEVHWGRWEFIPPEQFECRTRLDASVDTYAVAGLVVLLSTGRGPFRGDLPARDRRDWAALRESYRKARSEPMLDGMAAPLRSVMARALSPDPASRFRTARELQRALEGA